jgi:hypothetical protein
VKEFFEYENEVRNQWELTRVSRDVIVCDEIGRLFWDGSVMVILMGARWLECVVMVGSGCILMKTIGRSWFSCYFIGSTIKISGQSQKHVRPTFKPLDNLMFH